MLDTIENIKRLTKKISEDIIDFSNEIVRQIPDHKLRVKVLLNKMSDYEDLEEDGRLIKLPCKIGDIVYDIVLCDDGKYYILKMKVCNINPFGEIRNGKVWNMYLENDYTKAYRSFYDFNRTTFINYQEAKNAYANLIN